MLVLTRKTTQTIHVGDAVITILQLKGGGVRIGIDAPPAVNIVRGELLPPASPTNNEQRNG